MLLTDFLDDNDNLVHAATVSNALTRSESFRQPVPDIVQNRLQTEIAKNLNELERML
jgi:hypothetical protein